MSLEAIGTLSQQLTRLICFTGPATALIACLASRATPTPAASTYQVQGTGQCIPVTSRQSRALLHRYRAIATSTQTELASMRIRLGVGQMDSSLVVIVGDTTICRIAAERVAAAEQQSDSSFRVAIVAIDSRRVVMHETDTTVVRMGYEPSWVFNADYSVLLFRQWQ